MVRLLPAPVLEPPPGYVAFVAAHLEPLRAEATGAAVDADEAQRLYPEALTDVAVRWRWLELVRRWLRRPQVAERYLRRAFHRRLRRWREQSLVATVDEPADFDIRVWTADRLWSERPRRAYSSGASRMAPYVRPVPSDRMVLAEASVAWWHAYEAHRRRRRIALAVAFVLLIGFVIRLHDATVG